MATKKFSSLSEIAKDISVNKSQLTYYALHKLIIPVDVVGKMQIYDKNKTIKRIRIIKKYKDNGMKLRDIYRKLS